ncbi:MAG TPA: HAMP domain-containing sensor histidine kinase [Polyangiaceae bacterium]|nr:HAMP domain-containing sensor histidine kinase [Polyangiaceae bacterium]
MELAVLDAQFRPALGVALAQSAIGELAPGQALALPTWSDAVDVVVATPWRSSPCAYVAARGHLPDFASSLWPSIGLLLLPVAGISAALLIAIGPVVRRIRRLTAAVTSSASAGFTRKIAIEGSDEIAVLARSFDAASRAVRTQLAAVEQRERILRDFLGDTTHDVMIPLTVLQAHLATLQERERDGGPQDHSVLTAAMDEAHYLGALMQNLGAVAKLEAGQHEPAISTVDLNRLVQRVVSRHRTIAARLQIAIEFAVPDEAIAMAGDITLIEQAVSNVVYNAVRHNRPGGHVAVILEPLPRDGFSLRVLDDGPGIPAEELSLVIARGFRRGRARTRGVDGSGLGLDITRRVAELHQLELSFKASEAGGLEVILEGLRVRDPAGLTSNHERKPSSE